MNNSFSKAAVVIVQPAGYPHSAAFQEIAETVYYGLRALGYEAVLKTNNFIRDGLNIVFGAHLLSPEQSVGLPERSIIYNLEQVDPSSMWGRMKPLLGRFPVWDYSTRNIEAFRAMGHGGSVFHLPIGFMPELARIKPAPTKDIDVLFYGSVNDRRKKILEALGREGLRVGSHFGVYGAARDALIARSKVVLNLHFYDSSIFELVRVSYLLANRKAVVAECNENTEMDQELDGAFAPARYDRLVEQCKALVSDDEKRKALEETAFEKFSRRDEISYLRAGLAWAGSFQNGKAAADRPVVTIQALYPRRLNIGSGKDFRPEFLNVDWNDYWGPDIIMDLNQPVPLGKPLPSSRFGELSLEAGSFDEIVANDLLEHIRDLSVLMTSCLRLLKEGGELKIKVPYDLSYGAWQDPTHVRAFNERSWLYYTDWFWYLGWTEARFDLASINFGLSDYGRTLKGKTADEMLLRHPRAVDEMQVVLRKRALTREEIQLVKKMNFGRKPYGTAEKKEASAPDSGVRGPRQTGGSGGAPPSHPANSNTASSRKVDAAAPTKETAPGLVTIVLAVQNGNRLKDIQKCLRFLQMHTPEPHEVIFALPSGGTSDAGALKWLKRQAETNPGITCIETGGAGFASLCNRAIGTAAGEYLVLLDSGVEVTEGWLSGMVQCSKNIRKSAFPEAVLVGPVSNLAEGPQRKAAASAVPGCRVPVRRLDDFCVLFPRSLFEKTGPFDEAFNSRHFALKDLMRRAALEGFNFFMAADSAVYRDPADKAKAKTPGDEQDKNTFEEKWGSMDPFGREAKKLYALKLFENAVRAEQEGGLEKAMEFFVESIKGSPLDELRFVKGLYYRFARMLIADGEFTHALNILCNMPESAGEDALGLELRGYCKDGLGELEEAESLACRSLELNRGAGALNLLGVISFKKGAPEKAVSFFEEAIAADNGFGEAYSNLGAVRWAEGKKEEALSLFERAFILSPASEDIITNYHDALMAVSSAQGILENAMPAVQQAVLFYPAKRRLRHILAELLFKCGRNSEALGAIEEAFLSFGVDDEALAVALSIRELEGPKAIEDGPGKEKEKTISMCMIVRNEEKNIVRALLNLRPFSDEMIVVDTGSSDRTKDVARALGAMVFDFPWTGDFSEARNFSISKASGGWILVMDADEVISQADRKKLRALIEGPKAKNTAFVFTTRNYVLSPSAWGWRANDDVYPEQAGTGWLPSIKARLFENDGRIRFRNRVHELVEDSLAEAGIKTAPAGIPVHHYGKLHGDKVKEKGRDYLEMGMEKLSEKGGDDFKSAMELGIQAAELGRYEDSVRHWKKAASIRPGYLDSYLGMADSLWSLGRYEEAKQAIDDGYKSPLDRLETSYLYARCQVMLGEAEAAASLLEKVTVPHPMVQSTLALAYLCAGKKEKAGGLIRQAGRFINMPATLAAFARKLLENGRTAYAMNVLEGLRDEKIMNPEIAQLLAECYLEKTSARAAGRDSGAKEREHHAKAKPSVKPRVSVIIPSYNHERYVQETIRSVLGQTYQDFEIVITDDCSSDRTVDEIKKFDDIRIRLFGFNKNQGVSVALNNCIKEARGEYIAAVGSDDAFLPEKLERQAEFLYGHPEIAAVFTHAMAVDEDGNELADRSHPCCSIFNQTNRTRFEWLNRFFYKGNCLCAPSVMIRKSCFDTVGLFDPRYAQLQDFDFWIRLCLEHEIHIIPEKLIRYRVRLGQANLSGAKPESAVRSSLELVQIFGNYLKIKLAEDFLRVFPEASKYNVGPLAELLPFFTARLALESRSFYPSLQHFGMNVLFGMMEDKGKSEQLLQHCKFGYGDFIKLTGQYDMFNQLALLSASREALRLKKMEGLQALGK